MPRITKYVPVQFATSCRVEVEESELVTSTSGRIYQGRSRATRATITLEGVSPTFLAMLLEESVDGQKAAVTRIVRGVMRPASPEQRDAATLPAPLPPVPQAEPEADRARWAALDLGEEKR